MSGGGMDLDGLKQLLSDVFAPMVQQMNIAPVAITPTGAEFHIPENPFIARTDGIICGQAVASISDSVGVLALFAHNTQYRIMTTVDMTTSFMRPLRDCALDVEAIILSNGKRMATVRIAMYGPKTRKRLPPQPHAPMRI